MFGGGASLPFSAKLVKQTGKGFAQGDFEDDTDAVNGEVTIFASACRSSLSDTNKLEHMLLRRFGLDPAMWGLQVFLAADAGNSTECLTSNSQLEESMIPRLDARLPFQLWCKQIPKGSSRTPTNPTARVAVTPVQAAAAVQAARNLLTPGAVPMPAAAAPAAAAAAAAAATQQASLEKSTGNGKERKVNALAKRQKQVKTWLVFTLRTTCYLLRRAGWLMWASSTTHSGVPVPRATSRRSPSGQNTRAAA